MIDDKSAQKICAVVVLYNPEIATYNNIQTYSYAVDKLFVVDNSTNTSIVHSMLPKNSEYISCGGNKGIAYALNIGISACISYGCDWVLTMDQDSYFESGIAKKYIDQVLSIHDLNVAVYCPQYIFDRKKTTHSTLDFKNMKYCMQSANLLNCRAYEFAGPYKEDLFIDVVDYEYCFRLREMGYKIVQLGQVSIKHNPATTRTLSVGSVTLLKYGIASPLRYYYQSRNLLYVIKKYRSINMVYVLISKIIKIILFFPDKRKYIQYFFDGVKDFKDDNYGSKEYCDSRRFN